MNKSQPNSLPGPKGLKNGPARGMLWTSASLFCRRLAIDAVYLLALAIALPWLLLRSIKTGRYRSSLATRSELATKFFGVQESQLEHLPHQSAASKHQEVVWLHGVSVGEVQLLAALYSRWKTDRPDVKFVVTTTTESGMDLARRSFPDADVVYFPWDLSWSIRRTIKAIRPSMLVLGELELWPNLIEACNTNNVPVAIVNGRLSERSFRGYRRLRFITQRIFRQVALVLAQTQEYAERFTACGCKPERVRNVGGLKFDNASFDSSATAIHKLRSLVGLDVPSKHPIVVVGSTQAPEEDAAIRAFEQLLVQHSQARMILVPRHPDRFESVHTLLKQSSVRTVRRSQIVSPISSTDWDVLLVDSVGELRWWWGLAEVAVVGGSFGKRGGQNMIEPSAFGCNVAVGPNTSNFRDVVNSLKEANAIAVLPNLAVLPEWLTKQVSSPDEGRARGAAAQELVRKQQGATGRTLHALTELLQARNRQLDSPLAPEHKDSKISSAA
ncbi:MAG: 3-deoxy-D-manno-octulosonic acid transferase [Pirellulaceae bacterium]